MYGLSLHTTQEPDCVIFTSTATEYGIQMKGLKSRVRASRPYKGQNAAYTNKIQIIQFSYRRSTQCIIQERKSDTDEHLVF